MSARRLRAAAWDGVQTWGCVARTERTWRPLDTLAVTSPAVPEKALNAMEGRAFMVCV